MKPNKSLQVLPDSIQFHNLEVGESETMDIWAKNISKKPMKIRFSLPFNSPFTIDLNKSAVTPPGLEVKSAVHFTSKNNKIITDTLKVECDDSFVEVPIISYPPSASIKVSPLSFDLGIVAVKTTINKQLSIENTGTVESTFTGTSNNDRIKILPPSGNLAPQQKFEMGFSFQPLTPGKKVFSLMFNIANGNSVEIPCKAEVVDHAIYFKYENKEINEMNFGHVYFGQKKIVQIEVVNTSPCKRSFVINPPQDPKSPSSKLTASRAQSSSYDPDVIFSSIPCEGLLGPNGSTVISLVFQPSKTSDMTEDIEYLFSHISKIEVVETGQALDFQLSGHGIRPNFKLSNVDFNFDYKKVHSKTTQELTILNKSQFLPLTYEISQVAQFRFNPINGNIPTKGSKKIKITFFPKNIGEFEETAYVTFCNGLAKRHINLVASSLQTSDQPKPFMRTELYETDQITHYNALHPDIRFGWSMKEINRNTTMRNQYDKYITDSAAKRSKIETKKTVTLRATKDINAYLQRTGIKATEDDVKSLIKEEVDKKLSPGNNNESVCEGIKPPNLKMMHIDDNLVIPSPEKFGLISRVTTQRTSPFQRKKLSDDKVMLKTKFKPFPTTPPEINECSRPLTPTQQLLISTSHQVINFGVVSVFSSESRSFTIVNNLEQYIFVEFDFHDSPELKKSTPNTQVVPPMQTAGFDITFSSNEQVNFVKTLNYTINKVHEYILNIVAQVVPIELRVSRTTIEFRFPYDYSQPFIKEFLTIHNTSNSVAEFTWNGFNENNIFSVAHSKSKIEPHGAYNAEFTFTPGSVSHFEQYVNLDVIGGPSKRIRLVGDAGKPKLTVNKKNVQFGLMPIGVEKTQKIRLKNSGRDDAIFTIVSNNQKYINISPLQGRIGTGDFKMIIFTVKCETPEPFEYKAQVQVAGANPINITLNGQAELPKVELEHESLDYGKIFIGSSISKKITVKNVGQIPAVLFLDLSDHKSFHIEFSSELSNVSPTEATNSILQVNNIPSARNVMPSSRSIFPPTSEKASPASSPRSSENASVYDESNLYYKMTIVEHTDISFILVFQPNSVGDFSFELPFTMMNLLSSSFHIQPFVTAEAVKPPLLPTPSLLHFGPSPLFSVNNPNNRPIVKEILLKNNYHKEIQFRFDNTSSVFFCDKNSGNIEYSSYISVFISFKPNKAQPYNYFLPLYVETDEGETFIGNIQLTGIGTSRLFKTSTNYICLPIVPLNVKIERTIELINSAFIDANITVHTTLSEKNFPLSIIFAEGNKLKHTEASKPILISFESAKPLSFSSIIALTSDSGVSYSFTVSATTDNSVFTLYPFLSFKTYHINSSANKPITATNDVYSQNTEFLAQFLSAADYVKIENLKGQVTPLMAGFVLKILNVLILNSPISMYPDDIANSEGQLLFDIISNMSGNKKPQIKKTQDLLDYNEKILKYLMACGAHLAEVKPEFLLPKEQFLHFMRNKVTNRLLGIDFYGAPERSAFDQKTLSEFTSTQNFMGALMPQMNALGNLYHTLSTEAYTFVIMQIVKLFMVSKCDVDKFNNIPGIAETMKDVKENVSDAVFSEINRPPKSLAASNIYSTIESSLLKWLTVHYNHIHFDEPAFITDFSQINDPKIFKAVISSHRPNEKIKDISTYLKSLKMSVFPTEEELRNGNQLMECFFCFQLYQTIPHYIPATVIEFNTQLNKPLIQCVSISNPSRNEVLYTAILEGSPNFKAVMKCVVLSPNQTIDFPVEYNANTHILEKCRLTLQPGRPRTATKQLTTRSGKSTGSTNTNNTFRTNKTGGTNATNNTKNSNFSGKISLSTPKINRQLSTTSDQDDSLLSANGDDGVIKKDATAPVFASTIVVDLVSDVQVTGPLKSIKIEGKVYEPTSFVIPIESPIKETTKFKVISRFFKILDENEQPVSKEKANVGQQILDFLVNPSEEIEEDESLTQFDRMVKDHKPFLFSSREVELPYNGTAITTPNTTIVLKSLSATSALQATQPTITSSAQSTSSDEEAFKVEFNPISLGTYRCLILFLNDDKGEFVYEIIAKALLPTPVILSSPTIKVEAKSSTSVKIPIEILNINVPKAMAYSYEKTAAFTNYVSERKFKELLNYRTREVTTFFNQSFMSTKFFSSVSSTQYFEVPPEVSTFKSSMVENFSKESTNIVPLTFSPQKPGEYPNHIVMVSPTDVRVYLVNGIALAETQHFDIDLDTIAGKEVTQEIPINNPSKELWNYKTLITGSQGFTCPSRFSVEPQSTYYLILTFTTKIMGEYKADLTVTNMTKEAVVVYKLISQVAEPLAERKIVINCRARELYKQKLELPPFITNGLVKVSTTVPILECPQTVHYLNKKPKVPFEFSVFALRSGVSVGELTFTESATKLISWFVIECNIDSPLPEDTICVHTEARNTATIEISLTNPKDIPITFDVDFNDTDFFGPRIFTIQPNTSAVYQLVFSPLKEQKRLSSISFFNDTEGEFIYLLDCTVDKPEIGVLSPLECPIGKSITTTVILDNPLSKIAAFTVENDNPDNFAVNSKPIFHLNPKESKQIAISFIPATLGTKEVAQVAFKSSEIGDYFFKLQGTGKPPQPLSPIIVECPINSSNSTTISFSNPFRKQTKFLISLNSDVPNVFNVLTKKKNLVLNHYNETTTIPIVFSPQQSGQYKANVIISRNDIQWFFPIIGSATITESSVIPVILGTSGQTIVQKLKLPIVGEREEFKGSEYSIELGFPKGYDFLSKVIDITSTDIISENRVPTILITMKIAPKRPLNIDISITAENPLKQKWNFKYHFNIGSTPPISSIELECILNKEVRHRIVLDEIFKERTPYHAYFAPGSAIEFHVTKDQGYIDQSLKETIEMPFEVVFQPKMYGKVMKGLLVIDTLETQYLYEYVGKIPCYIPPNITWGGRLDNTTPESVLHWKEIVSSRKRNIIKDNIESSRIKRPKSTIITPRQKFK